MKIPNVEIYDLNNPGPHGQGQIRKKKPSFQKSFSFFPHMWKHNTYMYSVLMSIKPSTCTKIAEFMAVGSGVQTQGHGWYGHLVNIH